LAAKRLKQEMDAMAKHAKAIKHGVEIAEGVGNS